MTQATRRLGLRRCAWRAPAPTCVAGVLLAGLAVVRPAVAQHPVPGRVYDEESRAAIAQADVQWIPESGSDGKGVRANSDGAFSVGSAWGPGGTVEVSALGYRRRSLAWDDAVDAGWRIGLARDPLALDEVVVTASIRSRRRSEIAIPIATIEAAAIAVTEAASVDRLLEELPGLQVTRAPPIGSNLMIRGIGGARVLVLLDGQPAGGALIEDRDLSRMSLSGVERIEVVKGPLSSLYGSDALGGVVNIITSLPASGFQVDGRALSATAGRMAAEATVRGGGRLRYRANGSWRQDNRVPGLVTDGQDAFARVWDLRYRLHFSASPVWDLRADFSYLRERQRWPVGGGFSGFNDNSGVSAWFQARRILSYGEWTGSIFAQEYDHLHRSARGDAPITGNGDASQWERLVRATTIYSVVIGHHQVDLGIQASGRAIRSPDKLIEERVTDRQLSFFLQDAWHLGESVLSGGTRLTWNDRWGSNISPTLGLTWPAGQHVRLRASVARGFRAPSFKELTWEFANLGAGYVLRGFPGLEAERSWNVAGGAEWRPRSNLRIDAEVYSNRIEKLIELGFAGHTPSGLSIFSPRNVTDAITQGFEARIQLDLGDFGLATGYAFLDARESDSDTRLSRRARHSGRVRASWTAPQIDGLRIDITGHLTGSAPIVEFSPDGVAAEAGTQERLTAVDVQTAFPLGDNLELRAGVDNLFDARPKGWQSIVERRFRLSAAVKELFTN